MVVMVWFSTFLGVFMVLISTFLTRFMGWISTYSFNKWLIYKKIYHQHYDTRFYACEAVPKRSCKMQDLTLPALSSGSLYQVIGEGKKSRSADERFPTPSPRLFTRTDHPIELGIKQLFSLTPKNKTSFRWLWIESKVYLISIVES